MKSIGPGSESAKEWSFKHHFIDCCALDVQELRTEILRRLGPPAKDPEEIAAWTMLFPKTKYQDERDNINSMTVVGYALYLRRLGLQIKRRQIPRAAPKSLHFSEVEASPDASKLSYSKIITIGTEEAVSEGYIVVEFDVRPVKESCDFIDSKLIYGNGSDNIDNKDLREYVGKLEPPKYGLAIGKALHP
jgi:hypothetical protein